MEVRLLDQEIRKISIETKPDQRIDLDRSWTRPGPGPEPDNKKVGEHFFNL